MRVMRLFTAVMAMALFAQGCGGTEDTVRTVLVDFSSDEIASFALLNFPEKVAVRQGDTIRFRQTWTGEPHTVTGGRLVNEGIERGEGWIRFFEAFEGLAGSGAPVPNPDDPGDATVADFANVVKEADAAEERDAFLAAYNDLRREGVPLPDLDNPPDRPFVELVELVEVESAEAFEALPFAFNEEDGGLAQNVSQPCYLREGAPPEDPNEPCADDEQEQPEFDGDYSYYNSGVIPYEGPDGNTFDVQVADDATPGSYVFYCNVHGFGQRTEIEIRPSGAEIPSEGDVARQAREETREIAEELSGIYEDAADDQKMTVPGPEGDEVEIEGPFAGLPGGDHSAINEFVPETLRVRAGEPITWKMMGADHTISFNVPRYFPIMEFLDDGTVRINPRLEEPAGGAVGVADEEDEAEGETEGEGEGEVEEEAGGGPIVHDGGEFDGTGFWSSGLIGAEPYLEYTMRITEPGTYSYACLLHPPMVGRIEVT